MDAQSGFESLISSILNDELLRQGRTAADIAQLFALGGALHTLQPRLKELDRIALAGGAPQRFIGSQAESEWRQRLYRLRNEIVHQGRREVSFDDAKAGISSGLQAAAAVQALLPAFQRKLSWSGQAVQLAHINNSAGRLARMFEI